MCHVAARARVRVREKRSPSADRRRERRPQHASCGMAMRAMLVLLATACACAYRLPVAPPRGASLLISRCRDVRCAADGDSGGDTESPADSQGYYEGMLKSPLDFRSDEDLDNITPNIKFVAISTLVIFGLCAAFVLANPPPPASLQ